VKEENSVATARHDFAALKSEKVQNHKYCFIMKTCDTFLACLSSIVGYRFGYQWLVDYFE
jgi:hypothetical protein